MGPLRPAASPLADGRAWMAARARNALRRAPLILGVGAVTFVTTLVVLVLVPREARLVAQQAMPRPEERPDTVQLVAAITRARSQLAAAEASLAAARGRMERPAPPPPPADTMSPALVALRDTLAAMAASLDRLLERAANAPLPASYRALGESPLLRDQPRVRLLLDSLGEIEREREAYEAVGGVDPIFVAITSRATETGKAIQAIAEARRAELRRDVAALTPRPPPPPPAPVSVDTLPFVARRDAAVAALDSSLRQLARAHAVNAELDRRVAAARELASLGAPPLAMLAAALVLGVAVGFAAALAAELRRPRVTEGREAERITGVRVLAVGRPEVALPERARRRADLEAPPGVDTSGQSFRLLYSHLAATGGPLPVLTVTGDEPGVAAVVAVNVAAMAAFEARSTLLIDADLAACGVAGILRLRPAPGTTEVLAAEADWAEVIVPAMIGRDRSIDVVTSGAGTTVAVDEAGAIRVRRDLARLARRYDLVVLVVSEEHTRLGARSILPAPDVVYCARAGRTRLRHLAGAVDALRSAGTRVRAIAIWTAEPPAVPPREATLAAGGLPREGALTR